MAKRFYHPDNGNIIEVIEVWQNNNSVTLLKQWLAEQGLTNLVKVVTTQPNSISIDKPYKVIDSGNSTPLEKLLLGSHCVYVALNTHTGDHELLTYQMYISDYVYLKEEHYLMQLFTYKHLPQHIQAVSKPICELAVHLDITLPNNPEKTTALRKLREAKDCAVTALLFK
jgi:hypothetical protein